MKHQNLALVPLIPARKELPLVLITQELGQAAAQLTARWGTYLPTLFADALQQVAQRFSLHWLQPRRALIVLQGAAQARSCQ